jgi:uncharacterized protein with HEPN domain
MSGKRSDREYLYDIKVSCERVLLYIDGLSFEDFVEDIKTQDAILRNLEIIGEAIKKLSPSLKSKYKDEIPWKEIAGMRDRCIHAYFDVSMEIVWDTVKEDIPDLLKKINDILEEE